MCDSLNMALQEKRMVVQEKIDCHLKDAAIRYATKKMIKKSLQKKLKL